MVIFIYRFRSFLCRQIVGFVYRLETNRTIAKLYENLIKQNCN
nr:MAG TPA: hypothetical protein [Caudoviricetes sp.]